MGSESGGGHESKRETERQREIERLRKREEKRNLPFSTYEQLRKEEEPSSQE